MSVLGAEGGLTAESLRKMTYRHQFSDYLPWRTHDPLSNTYENVDETRGFLWECAPLCFAGDKTLASLDGIFRVFPTGSILQFLLYADDTIEPLLSAYEQEKTRPDDIVQTTTQAALRFFREGTGGLNKLSGIPVRNFRLFVSAKFPASLKGINLGEMQGMTEEILRGAKLHPRAMEPEDLLDWMRPFFNGCVSLNNRLYDEAIPIRKQIIFSETDIDSRSMSRLRVGDRVFACTTPKVCPKEVSLFQTNQLAGGIWGMMSDSDQIRTPFLHCLNVVFHEMKGKLHTKCNAILQQQGFGSFAPSLARKKEEYLSATDELEKGTRYVRVIPTFWVWDKNESKVTESITRAKRIWESQGYVMQEDKGLLPILFISSLPFGLYDHGNNIDLLDRDFIAPAESVTPVAPIQGDFTGGGAPALIFSGRKGQVIGLDIFDKHANNSNLLVAAGSGAGKSFLVNYIIYNYFARNELIRLIDIGGSYKKLCKICKGRFLDFGGKERTCLNPFTHIKNIDEDLSSLAAILLQMAYSATGAVPKDHAETIMSLLRSASRWAYEEMPEKQNHIDLVHTFLNTFPEQAVRGQGDDMAEIRTLARTLAFNIKEFTTGGSFGRWVNGPSTFDISSDEFVVLELEHIKPIKDLFHVITLQVVNEVTRDLYLSDRSRKRIIAFEEAWQYLKEGGEELALMAIIEEGYRRCRRYGGSFNVVIQSILDRLQFGGVGDVIHANSAFKFYLESEDFEKARKLGLIDYDNFTMELLKSVKSNRPKNTEIFMDTPFGTGVGRLVVDPTSYYVYSSDATDVSRIERFVEGGKSYAEAISEMAAMA